MPRQSLHVLGISLQSVGFGLPAPTFHAPYRPIPCSPLVRLIFEFARHKYSEPDYGLGWLPTDVLDEIKAPDLHLCPRGWLQHPWHWHMSAMQSMFSLAQYAMPCRPTMSTSSFWMTSLGPRLADKPLQLSYRSSDVGVSPQTI